MSKYGSGSTLRGDFRNAYDTSRCPVEAKTALTNILAIIFGTFLFLPPCLLSLGYQTLSLVYRMVFLFLVVRFLQCPMVVDTVENTSD